MTSDAAAGPGPLVLAGSPRWRPDGEIMHAIGDKVLVLPTAAAYERPERAVAAVAEALAPGGAGVTAVMVLRRPDAEDPALADEVRAARCIYLLGGSPLHLRSVLKDSLVLHAVLDAWHAGAVLVGAGEGAMALSDPMVDPRGGAFTVGFGFVRGLAVVPGYDGTANAQLRRTLALSPAGCAVVALSPASAVVRRRGGVWEQEGDPLTVFVDGAPAGLESLAGKDVW